MSKTGFTIPPHRATILVGYGSFGLEVLRRLLASAAPRGVLTWEEPRGGAAPGERHLRDLALLWLPDPMAATPEAIDHENAGEGGALEMMRDLYQQIERVGKPDVTPKESDFVHALSAAADKLLSATARANRHDALPLGLDVIVVARPSTPQAIGTLDRMLLKGMDRLANNTNLERAVQGSEALNFIAIFDFEHYWKRAEQEQHVRRALHDAIEQWDLRRVKGRPAFGRVYLVDGRTDAGTREPFHRVDEVSLFIEFLLFEGQRGGEIPRLYQPSGRHESAVATFGIRLVERSAGLLAHLAAARFGIGWLEYMAGAGQFRDADEALRLRNRLEPFTPATLDTLLEAEALRSEVEVHINALEEELTSLPVSLPDWPARVRRRYEETRDTLQTTLSARTKKVMASIAESHLRKLPTELRAGVEDDLRNTKSPVPAGSIIEELTALLRRFDVPPIVPPAQGRAEEHLQGIERLHEDFERFETERINVEALKSWWPLLAIALTAAFVPIANQLVGSLPPPDSMRFLLSRAYDALMWVNQPLILGVLLFAATWGFGALALQRSIAARVDRTFRFYNDPQRGRFVDRLRGGMKPGGAMREPIDYLVDRLLFDMALSVRGEVTREVGRVLSRLEERRREMLWLSEQLRGFLHMHGFSDDDLRFEPGRLEREGTGIRYALETGDDFEAMLRRNPETPGRFRSVQATHAPFEEWDGRYSRAFLVPIEFLDRLSHLYLDPIEHELAHAGTGPQQQRIARELLEFIKLRGSPSLAFRIKPQDGVPPDQRFCLLPPLWQGLDGILPALADLRMGEQVVLDAQNEGRGYLLRFLGGIDPKCLLEQP